MQTVFDRANNEYKFLGFRDNGQAIYEDIRTGDRVTCQPEEMNIHRTRNPLSGWPIQQKNFVRIAIAEMEKYPSGSQDIMGPAGIDLDMPLSRYKSKSESRAASPGSIGGRLYPL